MADNTNEYIEYHGILSGLRLVYATESLLDDRLFLRGYFKTPSSITSCRRDERTVKGMSVSFVSDKETSLVLKPADCSFDLQAFEISTKRSTVLT